MPRERLPHDHLDVAAPGEPAGLIAVAYALVCAGMFSPLLLTVAAKAVPPGAVLTAMAAACLAYVSHRTRPNGVKECCARR